MSFSVYFNMLTPFTLRIRPGRLEQTDEVKNRCDRTRRLVRDCTICHSFSGDGQVAKMSCTCILRHRGVQLILAYSCAMLAIFVASKDRGACFYFFCFLSFLFLFRPSLSPSLLSLLSFFSLSLGDKTKWPKRVDVSLNSNTINHSFSSF